MFYPRLCGISSNFINNINKYTAANCNFIMNISNVVLIFVCYHVLCPKNRWYFFGRYTLLHYFISKCKHWYKHTKDKVNVCFRALLLFLFLRYDFYVKRHVRYILRISSYLKSWLFVKGLVKFYRFWSSGNCNCFFQ